MRPSQALSFLRAVDSRAQFHLQNPLYHKRTKSQQWSINLPTNRIHSRRGGWPKAGVIVGSSRDGTSSTDEGTSPSILKVSVCPELLKALGLRQHSCSPKLSSFAISVQKALPRLLGSKASKHTNTLPLTHHCVFLVRVWPHGNWKDGE